MNVYEPIGKGKDLYGIVKRCVRCFIISVDVNLKTIYTTMGLNLPYYSYILTQSYSQLSNTYLPT